MALQDSELNYESFIDSNFAGKLGEIFAGIFAGLGTPGREFVGVHYYI